MLVGLFCNAFAGGFDRFITVSGDKLVEGNSELCFISFNIPNLFYVEDNLPFTGTNDFRLPDEFEIRDALESINQMGGQVVRTYTLAVKKADDPEGMPRYVLGPGQFNEEAFRALDKVLQIANETGIRLIIPFVDNWSWWGGIAEYAAFRGKPKEAFWSDPQVIEDFKKTIAYVINRKNEYTGVTYRDDKAILCWETGNELQCPASWTQEIARYIKSIDQNHLVMDGLMTSVLRSESLEIPEVDLVTSHHYPRDAMEMVAQVQSNRQMAKGKKPYIVGEFGFVSTLAVQVLLNAVIDNGTSGALIWSLRYHNRDGGFYWHSEPFGGDLYKAYLWPGFKTGESYDEIRLLNLMREKAFAIQGKAMPAIEKPKPPTLLPIRDVSAISWQGSTGAAGYDVERAYSKKGPWQTVATDVIDTFVQYRPLFCDTTAEVGKAYFYRIIAKNSAGFSEPSNIVQAPKRAHLTLVDEFADRQHIKEIVGNPSFETKHARRVKEDIHRLKGQKGDRIVYQLPGTITSFNLYTFFPKEVSDFKFLLSTAGQTFREITVSKHVFGSGGNEYGYYTPVLYRTEKLGMDRILAIEFQGEAELSRMEINYGK